MTTTVAPAGWYVIVPEGSAWVAVRIDQGGACRQIVEQASAGTHQAAGDRAADICEAIADGRTDEGVLATDAAAVVAAYDCDMDPAMCVVERILID